MPYLIDGYNLMHAGGFIGKSAGRKAFRLARLRFLDRLASALGPVDVHKTTVVLDSSETREGIPTSVTHKGLSIIFAVEDADADARIEAILGKHAFPRSLTVVSSDRRIREAARRRGATVVTSDDFWVTLDARKERDRRKPATNVPPVVKPGDEPSRGHPELSEAEAAHWSRTFAEVDAMPEAREALSPDRAMLTDADIARIAREVDREFD